MSIHFHGIWIVIDVLYLFDVVQSWDIHNLTAFRVGHLFGTDCHIGKAEGDVVVQGIVGGSLVGARTEESIARLVDVFPR